MKLRLLLTSACMLCGSALSQPPGTIADDARKSLATVSGQLAVPGLRRPVRVLRDRWGAEEALAAMPFMLSHIMERKLFPGQPPAMPSSL